MRSGDLASDAGGEPARVLIRVPPLDRHEHVQAVRAGSLRERNQPERVEGLPDEHGHLDRLGEAGVVRRVEVEDDPVRPVEPVHARIPVVALDAARVGHPQQGELVVHGRDFDRPRRVRRPARPHFDRDRFIQAGA